MPPPLVLYDTATEYRQHYENAYCREQIVTADGIRVYFGRTRFDHAFYVSSRHKGPKDMFAPERAQRIDWISDTLISPHSQLFVGWDNYNRNADEGRRVAVLHGDYVVVIEISVKPGTQDLKANFTTAYLADRSLEKIQQGAIWDRARCLAHLLEEN